MNRILPAAAPEVIPNRMDSTSMDNRMNALELPPDYDFAPWNGIRMYMGAGAHASVFTKSQDQEVGCNSGAHAVDRRR